MKKLLLLPCLLFIIFCTSCDVTSPDEANEAFLREALDDLIIAFNLHHLNEVMELYDYNFLHNGDEIEEVTLDWEIRMNDFEEMYLENINIEFNGEEALVTCHRRFYNNGIMVAVFNEPEDNGDISYWELDNNEWKITGNRKQN